MPGSERRVDRTPLGIHVGAGMMAVFAALMVAAVLPASAGAWRLVPVAVVLLGMGALTADPGAVVFVATVAYLLVIGFLVNQYGVLTWHGTPDMYRLLEIAGSSVAGLLVGASWRWARRPRPLIVPPEWTVVVPARALDQDKQGGVPRWLT